MQYELIAIWGRRRRGQRKREIQTNRQTDRQRQIKSIFIINIRLRINFFVEHKLLIQNY